MLPHPDTITSPLAKALLRRKLELNLSVLEFAKVLGVSHVGLRPLLHGGPLLTSKMAKQLAQSLGWTLEELGEMVMYEPEPKERKRRDAA
jgi:plasmid maintenance system antidote protein VapI